MKYKLGDFVRFVDEKMEGFVTRIIDEQMIGVTGDDDFEIPVLASKVTSVHGYEQGRSKQDSAVTTDTNTSITDFVSKGVYVGLVPDPKASSVIHFHILNTTSFTLLAALATENQLKYKGEFSGIIAPSSTVKVYSAQLADLQLWPSIIFDIIFHTAQNVKPPVPLHMVEKFKAKDFAGTKKKLPLLNDAGWFIRLDEPDLVIDAEKLKESFFNTPEEKVEITRPLAEVDLHIEKLSADHRLMAAAEILPFQLAHFDKALDAAIVHRLPEITFIHGAGNGVLKHEIHKLLSKNNRIQTFMDARKEKFGYGATRVLLK